MHAMVSAPSESFFELLPAHLSTDEPQPIRILMLGDVVGRPGRKILKSVLPRLRSRARLDFVTANGENLAGGFGITQKIFNELMEARVDVVTMGNHWADKPDVHTIRRSDVRLVLPQNLVDLEGVDQVREFDIPGRHKTVSILNLMGNFAMKTQYNDPFAFIEREFPKLSAKVASGQHIVIADIHAEASSEKQAIAWFMDGVLAGLVGTHTHTPTSDERVTRKGTAFLTDVGMTGPYESVIGMELHRSLKRYFGPREKKAQEVAEGDLWLCGFLLEIDPRTCMTRRAHRIQFREAIDMWTLSSVAPAVTNGATKGASQSAALG